MEEDEIMSEFDYGELLSAYLDGEVEGEELNRVNSLLATSAEARRELERLQETKIALSSAPRLSAPPDLMALLLAHPKLHQAPKRSWWLAFLPGAMGRWVWVPAGAAVLTVAVLVRNAPWVRPLPIEPLLAAHQRQFIDGDLHDRILAASSYSALLAAQHEKGR